MSQTNNTRIFYHVVVNTLIASLTTSFVWFALVFWVYLMTESVLASSLISGSYIVLAAISAIFFGNIVDQNKKKNVMMASGIITFILFVIGYVILSITPENSISSHSSPVLWILMVPLILGSIAGNLRGIALSTVVTLLIEPDKRDKANGIVGTANGFAFALTSVFSGLTIGLLGMDYALIFAIIFTVVTVIHLFFIKIPEKEIVHSQENTRELDIKGSIRAIKSIPGLFSLIFFTTFNNFLGGVFAALMDPYGLSLVSVETWGFLWGALSFGFIIGGILITKFGLGKNPLRTLFRTNMVTWTVCIFFTIQPSIVLLAIGLLLWLILVPFIEASEQTILQKVVPYERQGRVFGFAQSIESAATPLTTFLIGPIAQFIFIPFMTTGGGVDLIGNWFGVGPARGMALIFIIAGIIGLIITSIARHSKSFKLLAKHYLQS